MPKYASPGYFYTNRDKEAAKADRVPPAAQEIEGGDCPEFTDSLSISLSLKQPFKGQDELR